MKVISSRIELGEYLSGTGHKKRGFVPTMGALHDGHLSLVKRCVNSCEITVVSIFVNPTQFNNPLDLERYPRTPGKDIEILSSVLKDDDVIYLPADRDVYEGEVEAEVDLGNLDRAMEGKYRPGHFSGVVRVVKLLFDSVQPDIAFFGQKDFQQLAIIRAMARHTHPSTVIEGCPIIREPHGLAMSSRNVRLSDGTRKRASIIYNTLRAHSVLKRGDSIESTISSVKKEIESTGEFKVEYFEIVDHIELRSLSSLPESDPNVSYYGCIAVITGDVRLIDNMQFSFPVSKG